MEYLWIRVVCRSIGMVLELGLERGSMVFSFFFSFCWRWGSIYTELLVVMSIDEVPATARPSCAICYSVVLLSVGLLGLHVRNLFTSHNCSLWLQGCYMPSTCEMRSNIILGRDIGGRYQGLTAWSQKSLSVSGLRGWCLWNMKQLRNDSRWSDLESCGHLQESNVIEAIR